jgi:hypothetical protein
MTMNQWRYMLDLKKCVDYFREAGNTEAMQKDLKLYREAMAGALICA